MNKIEVIKIKEIENYKPCELYLRYPPNWYPQIPVSPYSHSVEEKTIQWLKNLGLITTNEEVEYIRKMEPKYYAGLTVSLGNYENVLIQCILLTFWLIWDDRCVEKSKDLKEFLPMLLALKGESVEGNDPYVLGWKHIGDEYERLGGSKLLRKRFSDAINQWAEVALQEADIMSKTTVLNLEQALVLRMISIGIRPTSILYERVIGTEFPEYIFNDPLYKKLIDNAALIVGIQNDLMSVGKDIRNHQITTNVILCHNKEYSTSIVDSYKAIIDIHDKTVREFDEIAEQFLLNMEEEWKERMEMYINQLRYADSGYANWHSNAVRYREHVVMENGVYIRILAEKNLKTVKPTMK
jgi:hypothetical protein